MRSTIDLRLQEPNTSDNLAEQYDRRLVERSKAGDAEAFARLYDGYADRVLGYMQFQVQDQHAAEGLAARVYATAWEHIACYEAERLPFSIWLYMIAREMVIEFQRSQDQAGSVTEILSPGAKGLEDEEAFRPCENE